MKSVPRNMASMNNAINDQEEKSQCCIVEMSFLVEYYFLPLPLSLKIVMNNEKLKDGKKKIRTVYIMWN